MKENQKRKTHKKKNNTKRISIVLIIIVAIIILILLALNKDTIIGKAFRSIRQALTGEVTVDYADTAREKLNFNYDWQFSKGQGANNSGSDLAKENVTVINDTYASNILSNTYTKGTSGETWENVSLPHTYNDIDTYDNYMESKQNGERSTYSGTAYYTKTFTIPSEYSGKKIYIEFEAARQAAKVSINGHVLEGTYENGFIAFGYDLTDYINFGAENVIVVMVDNSYPYYTGEIDTKIAGGTVSTQNPLIWHDSHWQPNYGGLYRNSYLYIVDQLSLTLPVYSFLQTEGTYVYTSDETATTAKINVEAQIQNNTSTSKNIKLISYVKNANGTAVLAMESTEVTLTAGEKTIIKVSDTLQNAVRWSTEYPYLYTVECKIICDDQVIDNNETDLGIRTYRFTNNYGAYLNGNYIKLNGWGQKPTNEWAGLGAAYPDWMQDYTIKLMKDANSNFIRWGHCAGSMTTIKSANKYGIITMQPGVEAEGNYNGSYTTASYEVRTDAFRDMLIYFRNEPSILIWEIGNQTIADTSVAETMVGYIQQYDHGNRQYATQNSEGDYTFNSTEVKSSTGTWANTTEESDRVASIRQGDSTMASYVDVGVTTQGASSMSGASTGSKPSVEGEYNRLEARRGVWDYSTTGYENFENKLRLKCYICCR